VFKWEMGIMWPDILSDFGIYIYQENSSPEILDVILWRVNLCLKKLYETILPFRVYSYVVRC
jgi:hypothetical protein